MRVTRDNVDRPLKSISDALKLHGEDKRRDELSGIVLYILNLEKALDRADGWQYVSGA